MISMRSFSALASFSRYWASLSFFGDNGDPIGVVGFLLRGDDLGDDKTGDGGGGVVALCTGITFSIVLDSSFASASFSPVLLSTAG